MSPKRAAIQRVARRLGVAIPEALVDALAEFDPSPLAPRWVFSLPPNWQLLSEIVADDFGQEWKGPQGVVIGENLDGDLVCLLERDGKLDGAVHLLRHESLELERVADSLADLVEQEGAEDDEPPAFELDDDEPRPEDDYPPLSSEESMGLAAALGKLLEGEDLEPEPEPEPLNPALVASIEKALDTLILQELLEIDPGRRQALVEELCASTGEARTPKAMLRRFISCLVESDHPEEVYGTDADLEAALRKAWS